MTGNTNESDIGFYLDNVSSPVTVKPKQNGASTRTGIISYFNNISNQLDLLPWHYSLEEELDLHTKIIYSLHQVHLQLLVEQTIKLQYQVGDHNISRYQIPDMKLMITNVTAYYYPFNSDFRKKLKSYGET